MEVTLADDHAKSLKNLLIFVSSFRFIQDIQEALKLRTAEWVAEFLVKSIFL